MTELKNVKQNEIPLVENPHPDKQVTLFNAMIPILRLGLPIIINFFCVRVADVIMLHFLGELGNPSYTAAAGIGGVWVLMVMGSPVFGFVSAIDTLVSQSYGKKDYNMCGVYYNRGSVFSFVLAIVLTPLAFFSSTFLKLFGTNETDAAYAQHFSSILVFHMILWLQYVAGQKFLNCQKVVYPQLVIMVITCILHPIWVYAFIHWFGFGFIGAAYARCFTSATAFIALQVYMRFSVKCEKTLVSHSAESIKGIQSYLTLGFPNAAMNCLGAWAYQIVYLMSSGFGTDELAANVALVNINMLSSTIHSGMSTGIATLVGNSIGACQSEKAKVYVKSAMLLTVLICGFFNISLMLFRYPIASYFSTDDRVIEITADLILIMNIELIFDNTQGALRGVLLGMGRQKAATIANTICYYIIMIPAAYILSYKCGYDLAGIWIGMTIGYATLSAAYIFIIIRENWEELELEAIERIERDKKLLGKS